MGVVLGDDSWFIHGKGDFIHDVALEKVKVQLVLSTCIEGETAYLAFDFALVGSIAVILGASVSELDNVIVRFQFAGEFAEIIPCG